MTRHPPRSLWPGCSTTPTWSRSRRPDARAARGARGGRGPRALRRRVRAPVGRGGDLCGEPASLIRGSLGSRRPGTLERLRAPHRGRSTRRSRRWPCGRSASTAESRGFGAPGRARTTKVSVRTLRDLSLRIRCQTTFELGDFLLHAAPKRVAERPSRLGGRRSPREAHNLRRAIKRERLRIGATDGRLMPAPQRPPRSPPRGPPRNRRCGSPGHGPRRRGPDPSRRAGPPPRQGPRRARGRR